MIKRVTLVVKKTSWETFVEERRDERVAELMASGDASVSRIRSTHEAHEHTVKTVRRALDSLGAQVELRHASDRARPLESELVVTVGGDGTLLSASHLASPHVPMLAINSAPRSSVGFYCSATAENAEQFLKQALEETLPRVELTRMAVRKNGHIVHNRVLNDMLYCHRCAAATSRYILTVSPDGRRVFEEDQVSSGLWVGPPAGSTAAQKSAGGDVLPLLSRQLQYVVREPYAPEGHSLAYVKGRIGEGGYLRLKSRMTRAEVFLDGPHDSFDVSLGDVVEVILSDEPLVVLGLSVAEDPMRAFTVPAPPRTPTRR
jgi:NAD+ kinase